MSHDTWLHRAVRGAVRPLARTPVTPNHLTTARLLAGLGAAGAFAAGTRAADLAGAALFVLSMLLDRADGELARQTGRTTPWGHRYDLLTDAACNAAVFVGIGIGQRGAELGGAGAILGVVAGAAVVAVLWMVVRLEALAGEGAARFEATAGFDPDDAMVAVPIAVALGLGPWLLVAAAVGAPLAALAVGLVLRSRARAGP